MKGGGNVDYKAVIEEQIQKLQAVQEHLDWTQVEEKDRIASTIASLCVEAQVIAHRRDYTKIEDAR